MCALARGFKCKIYKTINEAIFGRKYNVLNIGTISDKSTDSQKYIAKNFELIILNKTQTEIAL